MSAELGGDRMKWFATHYSGKNRKVYFYRSSHGIVIWTAEQAPWGYNVIGGDIHITRRGLLELLVRSFIGPWQWR